MRFGYKNLVVSFIVLTLVACSDKGVNNAADEGDAPYSGSAWNGEPLVDSRDGKTYKTMQIGDQLWMAENLNYNADSSYCYKDEESNCSKYGRLYEWPTAVALPDSLCGWGARSDCPLPEGFVQGVCPSGWHLPTKAEFEKLLSMVGGFLYAGTELKSTEGWTEDGNGTDAYSFSALPAGYAEWRRFDAQGSLGSFWSSTEEYDGWAYYMSLKAWKSNSCHKISEEDRMVIVIPDSCPTYDEVKMRTIEKYYAYSVRCLRDEPVEYKSRLTDKFIIDARDGQAYAITKIGNQVWMAENLKFETDSSARCSGFGLHYNWADAVGKSDEECGVGHACSFPKGNVRGNCPYGWHLPSKSEWAELIETVGGVEVAGKKLKTTPVWFAEYGTDDYGFSMFPAGYRGTWGCEYEDSEAIFWTSSQDDGREESYAENYAYAVQTYWYEDELNLTTTSKRLGVSVRCVRD
jgi:uncharacterized protein (TIGR02145 family)